MLAPLVSYPPGQLSASRLTVKHRVRMLGTMISSSVRLRSGTDRAKNLGKDSGILRFTSPVLVCHDNCALFLGSDTETHSFTDRGTGPFSLSRARHHEVKPIIRKVQNVHIPSSTVPPHPHPRPTSTRRSGHPKLADLTSKSSANNDDALQDWNERASSLFEWVGMVNICAQRYFSSRYRPQGEVRN
jgi:hypothetical protein